MRTRWRVSMPIVSAAMLALGAVTLAHADEAPDVMPVAFGADQVRVDPRAQAIDAAGDVHVEQPPFHLTSEELRLRRVPVGVELEGAGKASLCPCPQTPFAVRFHGATMSPPHDLVLRSPVLELFGVPIAWAPVVWLRSTARVGVLPPEVAWRGAEGLFVGDGVHLPWRNGDTERGVDLHAGAYLQGGVAVQAVMRTAVSESRIGWDRYKVDDGVRFDLRGATDIAEGERAESVAWRVDALRGARSVQAATDVDAVARPFDRADAQISWRDGGWTFASGVRTVALRGGDLLDLGVGGPVIAARRSDAIAHAGTYDATIEGGVVSGSGLGAMSFARAEGGISLTARPSIFRTTIAGRALGLVADNGARTGFDGGLEARATAGLPFARGFASDDDGDPWVHWSEPRLEGALLASQTSGVLPVAAGRAMVAPSGRAWVASAGLYNAIGRWGSRASAQFDASGGLVGDDRDVRPVLRGRAAANGRWIALEGEVAGVVLPSRDGGGSVLLARARVGPESALRVSAHVAGRDGVDPIVARALFDGPIEPASGFLAARGWTGGARIAVPLGLQVATQAGADYDFDSERLVAALGVLELHDACRCVILRTTAAHRMGRDGVDVWVSVDVRSP